MKKLFILAATAAVLFAMTACGTSFDNEKACNDWKAKVSKCGATDVTTGVKCEVHKNVTTCDISSYFKCLTDNYKCTKDVADISKWPSCAAKAKCS